VTAKPAQADWAASAAANHTATKFLFLITPPKKRLRS
jgi:hypothetical protein